MCQAQTRRPMRLSPFTSYGQSITFSLFVAQPNEREKLFPGPDRLLQQQYSGDRGDFRYNTSGALRYCSQSMLWKTRLQCSKPSLNSALPN